MTNRTPEEIARGLTEAERERLLGEEDTTMAAGIAAKFVREGLIEAHPIDPDGWIWSIAALAVRSHLESHKP